MYCTDSRRKTEMLTSIYHLIDSEKWLSAKFVTPEVHQQ